MKSLTLFLAFLVLFQSLSFAETKVSKYTVVEKEDFELIKNLYRDGINSSAIKESKVFLTNYPKSVFKAQVTYFLAKLIQNKDVKTTEVLYLEILEQYPTSPYYEDTYYYLGSLYHSSGRNEKAFVQFSEFVLKFPKSKFLTRVYFFLASISYQKGAWDSTRTYLEKIKRPHLLKANQKSNFRYISAWNKHLSNDFKEAKISFEKLLDDTYLNATQKQEILLQLGIYDLNLNHFQDAKQRFLSISTIDASSDVIKKTYFWFAEAYFWIHQSNNSKITDQERKNAIRLYSKNLKVYPVQEKALSLLHRGWLYYHFRNFKQADKDFYQVYHNYPSYQSNIELTYVRSNIKEQSEDWKSSNTILKQAIEFQSDLAIVTSLKVKIIRNLFSLEDCKSTQEFISEVDLASFPEFADEIYSYTGECHFNSKNWLLAQNAFEKISKNSRFNNFVFAIYLGSLEKQKKWGQSLELINKNENNKEIKSYNQFIYKKAKYLYRLKSWKESVPVLKRILKGKQRNPRYYLQLAYTYDQLKLRKKSLPYYEKGYKLIPKKYHKKRLKIGQLLGERYERKKNFKKAVEIYEMSLPLMKDPSKIDKLTLLISKFYFTKLKKNEAAKKWLLNLHNKKNTHINYEASMLLAEIYFRSKSPKKAIRILITLSKQPIKKTRWHIPVQFRLAELYHKQKDWSKAIIHYRIVSQSKVDSQERKSTRSRLYQIREYLKSIKKEVDSK